MKGYKEPSFQDRVAAAQRAKDTALAKLRDRPAVDEAELARKAARRQAKEAEAAARRAAVLEARQAAKAAKAAEIEAGKPPVVTEEERKAARDARYAARKNRKS